MSLCVCVERSDWQEHAVHGLQGQGAPDRADLQTRRLLATHLADRSVRHHTREAQVRLCASLCVCVCVCVKCVQRNFCVSLSLCVCVCVC